MIEVIEPGLETSVQDFPGRLGYWQQGFPPSGPMDHWSFRLANVLVGNPSNVPALECQFLGPTLKAEIDTVVAVTGADMGAKIDGKEVPMWESITLRAGQVLTLSAAKFGARTYVAFAGGIDCPAVLGSRATFHQAGLGGIDGHALKGGQRFTLNSGTGEPGLRVKEECRPEITENSKWEIEVVAGPDDDWIDAAGHERFLSSEWKLSAKSNRTGFRLEGPEWTFTDKATNKRPEHGQDPSNILDHGYPFGAVNLCGQMPIILVNDGPSTGGFINPYTVCTAAFCKLGQSRPGDVYTFRAISVDKAQKLRRDVDQICTLDSIA
ncbi:MAG: biotin-dependent carboxyltransferase family protein [Pseudomonadota bacterium]